MHNKGFESYLNQVLHDTRSILIEFNHFFCSAFAVQGNFDWLTFTEKKFQMLNCFLKQ